MLITTLLVLPLVVICFGLGMWWQRRRTYLGARQIIADLNAASGKLSGAIERDSRPKT